MKKILLLIFLFVTLCLLPVGAIGGYLGWEVLYGNNAHLSKQKILEILSKETLLYYSDGKTQLGSLFGQEHRIYVTIQEIPEIVKKSIIAAEDEDFYKHFGIDLKGTLRAVFKNVFLGKRQGASTITQQTVKNLYGRKKTNLFIKFIEMVNALKMERLYDKDQILEFYLNQFHVVGNGRGIGIASRHYFNKYPHELTLVEAAFIAGSVKAPFRYNPFTKKTKEASQRAKELAKARKNYVIDRLLLLKLITKEEHSKAYKEDVPFNFGKFQNTQIFVNELVQRQLSRPEVLNALGAANVEEIGTMGLKITTTLDKPIQDASVYALRRNLSRLEMILKGFSKDKEENYTLIVKPERLGFYVGKIDSMTFTEGKELINVVFSETPCQITAKSIDQTATNLDQALQKGLKTSKKNFLSQLQIGDYVLVSVEKITEQGRMYCDFETRPRIQGGVLVLNKGEILGMAGGFSPNEYNRAIFALRQPGSTFKTFIYAAALQLGWTPLDSLSNIFDVYNWQKQFYYPTADHVPSSLETTILGAGAKSENMASVWLLKHLLDKMNYDDFYKLLQFLEITKKSTQETLSFIARKFNATPDQKLFLSQGVLEKYKTQLVFSGVVNEPRLKVLLHTLHSGEDFPDEFKRLDERKDLNARQKTVRKNALKNALTRWRSVANDAKFAFLSLEQAVKEGSITAPQNKGLLERFQFSLDKTKLYFMSADPWQPDITSSLMQPLKTLRITPQDFEDKNFPFQVSQLYLDGVLSIELLEQLNSNIQNQMEKVELMNPLEKLYWHSDFKYSVGMYYVSRMLNQMGIQNQIQWVPSMPLGSNDVTLAELTLSYQTLVDGRTYRYFNQPQNNQILLIKKIEDFSENLLWEAQSRTHQLLSPDYSASILNVLRGTVTGGTATRLIHNVLTLKSNIPEESSKLSDLAIRIPSFGKTGTNNNYANGSYVGILPFPAENDSQELTPDNAFVIGSYVGYDTNEPMVRNFYRVYGGAGAIPAWIDVAREIVKEKNYASQINWRKLAEGNIHEVPFRYSTNVKKMVVPIDGSSAQDQESEDDKTDEPSDAYANDYSKITKNNFSVFLKFKKSESGGMVLDRQVQFFDPAPPFASNEKKVLETIPDLKETPSKNVAPKELRDSKNQSNESGAQAPASLPTSNPTEEKKPEETVPAQEKQEDMSTPKSKDETLPTSPL